MPRRAYIVVLDHDDSIDTEGVDFQLERALDSIDAVNNDLDTGINVHSSVVSEEYTDKYNLPEE